MLQNSFKKNRKKEINKLKKERKNNKNIYELKNKHE